MTIDCKQLRGRLLHVCRGYDASGKAVTTDPAVRERLLRQWHLDGKIHIDDFGDIAAPTLPAWDVIADGPGSQLARMFSWLGIKPSAGCKCSEHAAEMNNNGLTWCRDNIETIVEWLRAEAERSHVLFIPAIVRKVLQLSFWRFERAASSLPPADGNWCCVVTTAPREPQTVARCCESLLSAGWSPMVFAEPGSLVPRDVPVTWNLERLGAWRNWLKSCRVALEHSSADWILTIQDDVIVHPQSREFMSAVCQQRDWSTTGFVSLYTPKKYHHNGKLGTVSRVATGSLWGACALAFSRESLGAIVSHPLADSWRGAPFKNRTRPREPWEVANVDTALGKICNRLHRSMWFVQPSLVDHFAETSSIGHGSNLGNRNFGELADFGTDIWEQFPECVTSS